MTPPRKPVRKLGLPAPHTSWDSPTWTELNGPRKKKKKPLSIKYYSSWWFQITHLKNLIVKMGIFPKDRGEYNKYLKPQPSYSLPSFFTQFAVRFQDCFFLEMLGSRSLEILLMEEILLQLIWWIPLFSWFYTSQIMQDFFHQQYHQKFHI